LLDYLYSTKDLVISFNLESSTNVTVYSKSSPNYSLYAYSNAFFTNVEDCKSTSSYFFKFTSSTICYCSIKQKLVTTLTTKAEYVSLTYATKEAT
jgi:hypothetical protein